MQPSKARIQNNSQLDVAKCVAWVQKMFLGVFMKKRIFFSRIRFILSFIRVLVCLPFGYLLHSKRDVYIFCERGTDARDNGYHMFKYFVTHYPEKKAYYIITKDSPDRAKVAELGNVIK